MNGTTNNRGLTIGVVLVLALIAVVVFVNLPDRRSGGEKLGDAVDALPQGVDKAADELGDKSPAERAADKVEQKVDEIGDDLKASKSSTSDSSKN
jgi:hypothetical protein